MRHERSYKRAAKSALVLALLVLGVSNCGERNRFTQLQTSMELTQDYNPQYFDVLWVLDNRSQLFSSKPKLADEAKSFFSRLEDVTSQIRSSYRMGFITADMLIAKGKLQPTGSPLILEKNIGTVEQRTTQFSNLLTGSAINLHTSGENKSFEATLTALKGDFKPRNNVPLVIIFVSDSDDHSALPSGSTSAVEYYSKEILALKGGNSSLLRVYAINYTKLATGATVNSTNRCATLYNADIDSTNTNADGTPYFQDRFFKLANQLGGATADLCGSFSSLINIDGFRLKTLPNRFKLDSKPLADSIQVTVFYRGAGERINGLNWKYELSSNEIVFDQAPPEGSNIHINYLPQ